ncbi:hypothetical protein [Paenibacillus lutrae]|uniref:Uncharacterized protein n=1 Tax=Paenibacillus lutrae TaxID=2078573 RepID=A0A7X3FIQ1_9BACL|nr:hypothetical protein [Paenibacillus lutrae]MVP00386.1 hypothetical protein [Paenibacillus lutrae]
MADRFKAIEKMYLDRETHKTFKVWHPQIKIDGKWCFLADDSSRTKLKEAPDKITAFEMAITAIRRIEKENFE